MPKSLTFETGLVEYDINGAVSVKFNPADETFTQKLYDAFKTLDKLQTEFADGDDFSKFIELDKEMRAIIDDLLGEGVSDALFENMNCYALAGGLPAWVNLVMAILYEVTEAYEREFGKTDARVKEHRAKYETMLSKYRKGSK